MANAPGGPQQQPPYAQYVYVPHPQMQQAPPSTSVERVTVPLILFLSSALFIGWASWFGATSINQIQSSVKELSVVLNNYIQRQDERVDRIETVLERRTAERWTKTDQELFCAKTESIPGNKGWKCADTEHGFVRIDGPSIWDGVMERSAPVADVTEDRDRAVGRWSQPKVRATP